MSNKIAKANRYKRTSIAIQHIFWLVSLLVALLKPSISFGSVLSTQSRTYIPISNNLTVLKNDDQTYMIMKDYLTSTRRLDKSSVTQEEMYFTYGEKAGDSYLESTDKAFTGHRLLKDAGVYHAGARFYSPQLGQFMQADKAEGPNRYHYALNNPVSNTDPSGNCVVCRADNAEYLDISDLYTYKLEPHFSGAEVFDMPPDQGIPDSIYYPAMAVGVSSIAGAGAAATLPIAAGSSVASSISSGLGSALAYRSAQGAIGSVAIEAVGQTVQGDFKPGRFVEQAAVGAIGGKWLTYAKGVANPRYAAALAKAPQAVNRLASTRGGHFAYEFVLESAIASPLIAYGIANDVRADRDASAANMVISNYVATKAGVKVAMASQFGGGQLTGAVTKKAINRVSPHILTIASNPGSYAGLVNHYRTNPAIQEPIHKLESGLLRLMTGGSSH